MMITKFLHLVAKITQHWQVVAFFLLFALLIPAVADEPGYTPRLIKIARRAKSQGKTEVKIVEWNPICWGQPVGLKDALENSTAVLAKPLQKATFKSSESVSTLVKYRITAYLSKKRLNDYDRLPNDILDSFIPLHSDELIVITQGGTAIVEGVTITDIDEGDPGDLMKYPSQLLFLSLRKSGQLAVGAYGAHSFFEVKANSSIKALSGLPMSPIAEDLSRLGVSAVSKIRHFQLQQKR